MVEVLKEAMAFKKEERNSVCLVIVERDDESMFLGSAIDFSHRETN